VRARVVGCAVGSLFAANLARLEDARRTPALLASGLPALQAPCYFARTPTTVYVVLGVAGVVKRAFTA
jgi:hypothetical protein